MTPAVPADSDCVHVRPPLPVRQTRPAVSSRNPAERETNDTCRMRVFFVGSLIAVQVVPAFMDASSAFAPQREDRRARELRIAQRRAGDSRAGDGFELAAVDGLLDALRPEEQDGAHARDGDHDPRRATRPALSVCHVSPLFCVRKSPPRTSSA